MHLLYVAVRVAPTMIGGRLGSVMQVRAMRVELGELLLASGHPQRGPPPAGGFVSVVSGSDVSVSTGTSGRITLSSGSDSALVGTQW